VARREGEEAVALLAEATGLPKARVKDAILKGAVLLQAAGRKKQGRLRRASSKLHAGDRLTIHYDPAILALTPLKAELLADKRHYTIWNKPAGMLCQGTAYGDHAALLRLAEQFFTPRRPAYLVHRLDREAAGLILIAHSPRAAALLTALFKDRKIDKRYRAVATGFLAETGSERTIAEPLDGKEAVTHLKVLAFDAAKNESTLEVKIDTGRLHQIRRHLAGIGHALVGDARYGKPSKDGLQLTAVRLGFFCPFEKRQVSFSLECCDTPAAESPADRPPDTGGQNG